MKRQIILTKDGSSTIHIPEWNEQYHSIHGAVQEARYVYIEMGLKHRFLADAKTPVALLEIGFGTGLNSILTKIEATQNKRAVSYYGVDAYPIKPDELNGLNYVEHLGINPQVLKDFHACSWEEQHALSPFFTLFKTNQLIENLSLELKFDLIYFDAFGARVQPTLWTVEIFAKMYEYLLYGGVLVTYAAKGSVRRAMIEVGFDVERLPGPPGKREMLRATKSLKDN